MRSWFFLFVLFLHFRTSTANDAADAPVIEDDGTTPGQKFNFAAETAGAVVLAFSPSSAMGFSNLLKNDKDKYSICNCALEKKSVVIGLSEDILVSSVVLANYERYSSTYKDVNIFASKSYPSNDWIDLGMYELQPRLGEQPFNISVPSPHTRYLRFKFLTHFGNEAVCTLSQIKVHGTTVIASLQKQFEKPDYDVKTLFDQIVDDDDDNADNKSEKDSDSTNTTLDNSFTIDNASTLITEDPPQTVTDDDSSTRIEMRDVPVVALNESEPDLTALSPLSDMSQSDQGLVLATTTLNSSTDSISSERAVETADDTTEISTVSANSSTHENGTDDLLDNTTERNSTLTEDAILKPADLPVIPQPPSARYSSLDLAEPEDNVIAVLDPSSDVFFTSNHTLPVLPPAELTSPINLPGEVQAGMVGPDIVADSSGDRGSISNVDAVASDSQDDSSHEPAVTTNSSLSVGTDLAEFGADLARADDGNDGNSSAMGTDGDPSLQGSNYTDTVTPDGGVVEAETGAPCNIFEPDLSGGNVSVSADFPATSPLNVAPPVSTTTVDDSNISELNLTNSSAVVILLNSSSAIVMNSSEQQLSASMNSLDESDALSMDSLNTSTSIDLTANSSSTHSANVSHPTPAMSNSSSILTSNTSLSNSTNSSNSHPKSSAFNPTCLDSLRFSDFRLKMKQKFEDAAAVMTKDSPADEKEKSVFPGLMQKIHNLEMDYAIIERYTAQVSECYRSALVESLANSTRVAQSMEQLFQMQQKTTADLLMQVKLVNELVRSAGNTSVLDEACISDGACSAADRADMSLTDAESLSVRGSPSASALSGEKDVNRDTNTEYIFNHQRPEHTPSEESLDLPLAVHAGQHRDMSLIGEEPEHNQEPPPTQSSVLTALESSIILKRLPMKFEVMDVEVNF